MERLKKYGYGSALTLLLILAGFLAFYGAWSEGFSNTYYSAAVRSMMESWHNFFFASFDPGGFVTVDKPALGLWLQVLSAEIFGFRGWSLILPEALSAVISTAIVYHLAKRSFGKPAGLLSALIFSLTPVLIAVSRTNNLDSSLVMVLLFAAWALMAAAEKSSLKHLILAMVLVGTGFNIKMLEAFMVLPAFYAAYFFTSALKTGKKIAHLGIATAALLAVSLSWSVAVDLTPAGQRPFVGGSQNNSELNLAIGYNGIQRITGANYGSRQDIIGGTGGFPNGEFPDGSGFNGYNRDGQIGEYNGNTSSIGSVDNGTAPSQGDNGASAYGGNRFPDGSRADGGWQQRGNDGPGGSGAFAGEPGDFTGGPGAFAGGPGDFAGGPGAFAGEPGDFAGGPGAFAGGPGSESENGRKGILRIFNQQLAGQISWFLPMAFFGAVILFLQTRDKKRPGYIAAKLHFWLWAGSLLPMLAYFSFAGFFHRYYLSMMAPGIAILSGIGLVEMWKSYRGCDWKWLFLPASILATAALQCLILTRYSGWPGILVPILLVGGILSSIALIVIRLMNRDNLVRTMKIALGAGILTLLAAPAAWSVTPVLYGSQAALPFAGPELNQGNATRGFTNAFPPGVGGAFGNMSQAMDGSAGNGIISFLLQNRKDEKFLVAVSSANEASSIIIETGEPVMAMGGFSGTDKILTVEKLQDMVATGEVRYFLLRGGGRMESQGDLESWIIQNGTAVEGFQGLYDLSGLRE